VIIAVRLLKKQFLILKKVFDFITLKYIQIRKSILRKKRFSTQRQNLHKEVAIFFHVY